MSVTQLAALAQRMVADDKGLLAIDERIATCNRRFAALGIAQTVDRRRAWRDLIVTTPGLARSIGAIILNEETIRQTTRAGVPFATAVRDAGIVPGVKVDTGTIALAGHVPERITEGLDGLKDRLEAFAAMGARFAKWRGVITIAADIPTRGCIEANAQTAGIEVGMMLLGKLAIRLADSVLAGVARDAQRCIGVVHNFPFRDGFGANIAQSTMLKRAPPRGLRLRRE